MPGCGTGRVFAVARSVDPQARLSEFWATSAALRRVADGRLDMAVLAGPVTDDGLDVVRLGELAVVAVVSVGSSWAHDGGIDLGELLEQPTWRRPAGVDPVWRAYWLMEHHRTRPPRWSSARPLNDTDALLTVANGDGIGIAPSSWTLERHAPGVVAVPVRGVEPAPLVAILRAGGTGVARSLVRAMARCGAPEVPTPAEARVLALVRTGLSNAEIAVRLTVSVRTVESHVSTLLRKSGRSRRVQLLTPDAPPEHTANSTQREGRSLT